MLRTNCWLVVSILSVAASHAAAADISVNCDRGQSLSRAISVLPRGTANTITVQGTCTEYVQIRGLEDLKVRGTTGARLVQPPVDPGRPCLALGALTIEASRGITIESLGVQASTTDACSIAVLIQGGSADVRLRGVTATGGTQCFAIAQNSHASIAGSIGRDPGWAALGVFDGSAAHVEDSLFESTSPQGWQEGIVASEGRVHVHGTRIRNMTVGLEANTGGVINIFNFADYYPTTGPRDVVVECQPGTNFYGVSVGTGSAVVVAPSFVAGNAVKLRITNAGQSWGGETGAVRVADASTFDAGGDLEVVGSLGQGVVVTNNSYANLAGVTITGSAHAGLVVTNNSTANLDQWYAPATPITGSGGPDLFCDATSLIAGGDKAPGSTRQCANVQAAATVPLP
jgi:hypothetical protein